MEKEFMQLMNDKDSGKIIGCVLKNYCFDQQEHADLKQEIYATAWASFPSYEYRSHFTQWLYFLARNVAVNRLRKLSRTIKTVGMHNIFYDIEDAPTPAEPDLHLDRLKPHEQIIIRLMRSRY